MMLSELFVRVTGDTSDFTSKMSGVRGSLGAFEKSATSAHLRTGKLGNAFEALASRIAGVNPIVGKMASVLSDFAVGSVATVGILAGVAAVAVTFDKLTESSRKAMAAGDKLIETYNQAARIRAFGGKEAADLDTINKALEEHAKWLNTIVSIRQRLGGGASPLGAVTSLFEGSHSDAIAGATKAKAEIGQQLDKNIRDATTAADAAIDRFMSDVKTADKEAEALVKKAQADFLAGASSAIAVFDNLASHGASSSVVNKRLVDDYQKISEQIRQMGTDSGPATAELLKLRDALMANLVVAQAVAAANSTGTVGPLVGKTLPGMSLTPNNAPRDRFGVSRMPNVGSPSDPVIEMKDAVQEQLAADALHAQQTRDAIWGAAEQSASIIVSALNIGGGGRNSGLGGALGSTAGFALGFSIGGPIGGAIGATAGNIFGSLVGGLFDSHKQSVNANTQAVRALTQAMIQFAPSGFKVESYRYAASDPKQIMQNFRRYGTRGGAVSLGT